MLVDEKKAVQKSYYCCCGIEVAAKVAVVIQIILCLGANIIGLVFAIIGLVCLCCPSKNSYRSMRNVAIAQCVLSLIGVIVLSYIASAGSGSMAETFGDDSYDQSTLIVFILGGLFGAAHSAYAAKVCHDYFILLKNQRNSPPQVHPGFHPQVYQVSGQQNIDSMPYPMANQTQGYAQNYPQQYQGAYAHVVNVQTVV